MGPEVIRNQRTDEVVNVSVSVCVCVRACNVKVSASYFALKMFAKYVASRTRK